MLLHFISSCPVHRRGVLLNPNQKNSCLVLTCLNVEWLSREPCCCYIRKFRVSCRISSSLLWLHRSSCGSGIAIVMLVLKLKALSAAGNPWYVNCSRAREVVQRVGDCHFTVGGADAIHTFES